MASDQSPEQLGPLIVRAVACCESLAAQLKGARALAASTGIRRPSSQRSPIQTNPDFGRIPSDPNEYCNLPQRSDFRSSISGTAR